MYAVLQAAAVAGVSVKIVLPSTLTLKHVAGERNQNPSANEPDPQKKNDTRQPCLAPARTRSAPCDQRPPDNWQTPTSDLTSAVCCSGVDAFSCP